MRCYICNEETSRWPDPICDSCLGLVNRDLSEDKDDPELDLLIPYADAFESASEEAFEDADS